jgi:ATP-dependent helicase/nuclease subunit A
VSAHRLLRASAGTGKTYQLVQAYIGAVRAGRSPKEIVAITFTRSAAQELRARIRRGLLCAGAGRRVLTELMHAPIANFHGLALQLLRGFGFSARFPEGVELLGGQGDDERLFIDACEEAWFSGDREVTGAVEALAPHLRVDRGLPAALWQALSRAREDGRRIDPAELLGRYDAQELRKAQHETLLGVRARLRESLPEHSERVQATIEEFLCHAVPDANDPLEHWTAGWRRAGRSLHRRGRLGKTLSADDLELMRGRVTAPLAAQLCTDLAPHLGVLIGAGWQAYTAAKQQNRAADFGDIIETLVEALATRPELHRMVRQRFRAVLVDEAQDTNRLQRRLVRLLAGIDGPAAGEGEPAELFVVGDRKQAIYTFRGADPRSFAAFAGDLRDLGGNETVLTVSRRSSPELIAGINSLGRALFAEQYEPLEPLEDAMAPRALGRPGITWIELEGLGEGAAAAARREAGAVAGWIAARVEAGEAQPGDFAILLAAMSRAPGIAAALSERSIPAVLGGGRGLYEQPEVVDVVALLAWLADPTDRLSAAVALRSPVFGVSESALVSLFALEEESDPLAALRRGEVVAAGTGFATDAAALQRAAGLLPDLIVAVADMGAAELLEYVDHILDVRAVLLALEGGEQRVANLDRLWELASQFDRAGRGSAAAFARDQLENIRRGHKEAVASPAVAERRAVTISTVHQAKGLEYPVVVLADVRHRPRGETEAVCYARDHGLAFRPTLRGEKLASDRFRAARDRLAEDGESEQRRLLYVAVTRAQRELVIVGTRDSRSKGFGFARYLDPWLAGAEEEGVLARQPAEVTTAPPQRVQAAKPTSADRAWADEVLDGARPPEAAPGSVFALPVTAFDTFDQCPRRGYWLHDLRLPEPRGEDPRLRWPADDDRDPPLDPLSRGRLAHEVLAALERCGSLAAVESFVDTEISRRGYDVTDSRLADVRRDLLRFLRSAVGERLLELGVANRRHELPFRLTVDAHPFVVLLHGQIDLLYWDDGPVVLDYKHAGAGAGGLSRYATQLDAYALAVERLCGRAGDIRTRLLFLRDQHEPFDRVVTPAMRRDLEARAAEVGHILAGGARSWPGRDRSRCEALQCGFLSRCHRQCSERRPLPVEPSEQLPLFPADQSPPAESPSPAVSSNSQVARNPAAARASAATSSFSRKRKVSSNTSST